MSILSLTLLLATFMVIASTFYLRGVARRVGLHQEKEHWMVFGVFAAVIAVGGATKENLWVLLIGLLLAVFGVVYHACCVVDGVKKMQNEKRA